MCQVFSFLQATCCGPAAEKDGNLPHIIRQLFGSAVKKSSNTALESGIHMLVWKKSGASTIMALMKERKKPQWNTNPWENSKMISTDQRPML